MNPDRRYKGDLNEERATHHQAPDDQNDENRRPVGRITVREFRAANVAGVRDSQNKK